MHDLNDSYDYSYLRIICSICFFLIHLLWTMYWQSLLLFHCDCHIYFFSIGICNLLVSYANSKFAKKEFYICIINFFLCYSLILFQIVLEPLCIFFIIFQLVSLSLVSDLYTFSIFAVSDTLSCLRLFTCIQRQFIFSLLSVYYPYLKPWVVCINFMLVYFGLFFGYFRYMILHLYIYFFSKGQEYFLFSLGIIWFQLNQVNFTWLIACNFF